MISSDHSKKTFANKTASLTIDLFGGAIIDFHLHENGINPLSFVFSNEQMPDNNKSGAPYQGHFVCLGRWGAPSDGEINAGLPNHGQAANIHWKLEDQSEHTCKMHVDASLEGLHVDRTSEMDKDNPVYRITEEVTNVNPLGRLYHIVQHPTLARPFLDEALIVNSNATMGFNALAETIENTISNWPEGICEDKSVVNVISPDREYSSVFSYVVNKESDLGWISAYSPTHNLVLGYLWNRSDYPWINVWQHWEEGEITYRGLEFGSTGVHKPFKEILEAGITTLLGEKTVDYIDAGESISRSYISFLCKAEPGFNGIEDIKMRNGTITIKSINAGQPIIINSNLNDL